ncbi:MAG: phosphatidate cytidylyltransferase [Syntrophales bacterium]|jgi:phosphatidate cytidylyltransferase|nr:phosphatidate cytidylyltransferase [Syntrophales bacterium]MCK9528212.1 phosphatidate cytidylyltransferase [Syntrophales bacterium]MDX9921360.1 phosphatidate cytidylyltransferase [Syntrophales bacterium]
MSTHLKRWLTALLAVPVLLLLIIFGSEVLFALFIAAIIAAAMMEYNFMVFGAGRPAEKSVTIIIALLVAAAAWSGGTSLVLATVALSLLGLFSLSLLRDEEEPGTHLKRVMGGIFGILYIAVMMSFFILIRCGGDGRTWVFFLIVMAFSTDVPAFYAGRTWGRRKLLPSVSAGKTVEGSLGGTAGCVAACTIYSVLFLPDLWLGHAVVMGFMGSILGQLGDLSESALKRASNIKDSGFLFPGHGGILDRLDSFLFMAPFLYYYKEYIISL